jgi:hypothetical protein
MDRLGKAARAALEDVKAHGIVIGVSVMLTVLIRWVAWVLPIMLIGTVYAYWRTGWRIVIDRTHNRRDKRSC